MGMSENLLPAALYGAGFGALGYVVGGVGSPYVAGVTPAAYAAIGFLAAAAIKLNEGLNAPAKTT